MQGKLMCGKDLVVSFTGEFTNESFSGSLTSKVTNEYAALFLDNDQEDKKKQTVSSPINPWIVETSEDETLAITSLNINLDQKLITFRADEGWYRIKYAYPDSDPIDQSLSEVGDDLPGIEE